MSPNRTDEILDIAEREMRKGGFDAVSFRDIATTVGIKSASVHYHFPTKADLGQAVVARYADRFMKALGSGSASGETVADRLGRLADGYKNGYESQASTCLCAVLGAVVTHLPPGTSEQVKMFFDRLTEWTEEATAGATKAMPPHLIISMLQGAMVLAIATHEERPLLDAKAYLIKTHQNA